MITRELLESLSSEDIIASGYFMNTPGDVYLADDYGYGKIRKLVRYVAVRGTVPDWAMYYEDLYEDISTHWSDDKIARMGHKIPKSLVRNIVTISDEALNLYRN